MKPVENMNVPLSAAPFFELLVNADVFHGSLSEFKGLFGFLDVSVALWMNLEMHFLIYPVLPMLYTSALVPFFLFLYLYFFLAFFLLSRFLCDLNLETTCE